MPARNRKVLVTGGAGFLGSHLCDRLLASDCNVVCLDSMLTGRMSNIAHLMRNPRFSFVRHDVIERWAADDRFDEIYNLACVASPPAYQRRPVHTLKTCVVGAINMLELAEAHGARILQASTSEVYGDREISPQSEDYFGHVNSFGPRACYDEGKRAAETLFYEYGQHRGVEVRVARIFNTYGPRMRADDGRVVSNFVVQALRGMPLTIYGDGQQTRSFCYVDDLVEGLVRLMEMDGRGRIPVNLGNPGEFTMLDLARLVLDKTGSKSSMIYLDRPTDDPNRRRPVIDRAKKWLSWEPEIELSDGLDQTIAYFRAEIAAGDSVAAEEIR